MTRSENQALQRVMLVEDEVDIQMVARLSLEEVGGFAVEICDSGEQALRRAPIFRPQLILLDYMMPGLDGGATFRALAADPETADIPIIFITARAQLDEVAEYRQLGAIDVIIKPFDPMTLGEEVARAWQTFRRPAPDES